MMLSNELTLIHHEPQSQQKIRKIIKDQKQKISCVYLHRMNEVLCKTRNKCQCGFLYVNTQCYHPHSIVEEEQHKSYKTGFV